MCKLLKHIRRNSTKKETFHFLITAFDGVIIGHTS